MFEELHLCAYGVARHRNAPFADERARYLSYCADRGDALATLQSKANRLVYIVSAAVRKCSKAGGVKVPFLRLFSSDLSI
jgi:hypothetical protein